MDGLSSLVPSVDGLSSLVPSFPSVYSPSLASPADGPSSLVLSFPSISSPSSAPSASGSGWVPPRDDGQGTMEYSRGPKRLAVQIASDSATLGTATAELKDRIYPKFNKHSVAIELSTWSEVAASASSDDPFSSNIDMIYDVAACLWKANHRSLDSYLAVARQEMVLKHGSLPESLTLQIRRISRAAAWGRGPSKQATELPFSRLPELSDSESPLSPLGPCFPARLAILTSWWMLREIEANNLTLGCIRFDGDLAHLELPTSKVDPTGRGTTRSLCCTCSSASSRLCPYHLLKDQVSWATTQASSSSSPLFPTSTGEPAIKKATGQTITRMAEILGLDLVTKSGAPPVYRSYI